VRITENLGRSQYKGFELVGSQRLTRPLTLDYHYGFQSAQPLARLGAPTQLAEPHPELAASRPDNYGYFGHGFLSVNQYNTQSPNILLDGYEQFHLPYRRYFFPISTHVTGG